MVHEILVELNHEILTFNLRRLTSTVIPRSNHGKLRVVKSSLTSCLIVRGIFLGVNLEVESHFSLVIGLSCILSGTRSSVFLCMYV